MRCMKCSRSFDTDLQIRPWSLSQHPKIAVVNEKPTDEDKQAGYAWHSDAQEQMLEFFETNCIHVASVYWASIIRCWSDRESELLPEEVRECTGNLRNCLATVGISLVVAVDSKRWEDLLKLELPNVTILHLDLDREDSKTYVAGRIRAYLEDLEKF